jgi:curli biogenesis system outer membrane secretion channel CsgG
MLLILAFPLFSCGSRHSYNPHPVTSSFGPFDLKGFEQIDTLALFTFADAPQAPKSGEEVTTVLTHLLEPMGFTVINQAKLDQIAQKEPGLAGARDQDSLLKVAKLAGAQAFIIGEVGQWEKAQQQGPIVWVPTSYGVAKLPQKQWNEVTVAVAFRIIEVKTKDTIFSGQGTLSEPTRDHPEIGAEQILVEVLARCFQHIAPVKSGLMGYKAAMQIVEGRRVPVVTEIVPNSPAQRGGLHVGDVILACSDTPMVSWKTIWQHHTACAAEAGQTRSLQIARAKQRVTIRATALARSSFIPESTSGAGHPVRDLFAPL